MTRCTCCGNDCFNEVPRKQLEADLKALGDTDMEQFRSLDARNAETLAKLTIANAGWLKQAQSDYQELRKVEAQRDDALLKLAQLRAGVQEHLETHKAALPLYDLLKETE